MKVVLLRGSVRDKVGRQVGWVKSGRVSERGGQYDEQRLECGKFVVYLVLRSCFSTVCRRLAHPCNPYRVELCLGTS